MDEGCVLTWNRTKPLYMFSRPDFLKHRLLLSRIDEYNGEIELVVWIADKDRDYIVFRDASTVRKIKVFGTHAPDLMKLPRETLVKIKGYFTKEGLLVREYCIIHGPEKGPSIKYLGDIKSRDPIELSRHSPWYMRNPLWKDILWLQYYIMKYSREYLEKTRVHRASSSNDKYC